MIDDKNTRLFVSYTEQTHSELLNSHQILMNCSIFWSLSNMMFCFLVISTLLLRRTIGRKQTLKISSRHYDFEFQNFETTRVSAISKSFNDLIKSNTQLEIETIQTTISDSFQKAEFSVLVSESQTTRNSSVPRKRDIKLLIIKMLLKPSYY